ncbi:N-acetylmuramoyl-L-alanine amidase, partial [Enterococcus termitis]
MAKILLIAGHGAGDPGAIGNGTSEAVETRRVVNALVSPLKNNGMDVTVYDQNKNAFAEAQVGRLNFGGTFDYVFEVHFNSFNSQAKGTEAFITSSESSDSIEQDIVKRLSKYFVSRGVKRTNFSVIYNAKLRGMSSCLYEMCFIDNAADMQAYNNNFSSIIKDMANAIADGFGKTAGSGNASIPEAPNKQITEKDDDIMF